ncbi:MAG: zf-HC2 domain-containing protein [Actinomycetota bacterium]|nr:zf-HC2 domain-containing protein [Actinomycetota bacterium]
MADLIFDPDRHGELFSAYLDGELTSDEVATVSRLLDSDEEAVEEFLAVRDVRTALRLLPEFEVPAALLPDGHLGDRLSAYLDGELVTLEHRRVTKHLVECADCRAELQELDRARIAVRSLPGVETTMTDEIPAVSAPHRRRRIIAGGIGAAAAAALLVGFAVGGGEEPVFVLDDLATHHVARASAEPGFAVLPPAIQVAAP